MTPGFIIGLVFAYAAVTFIIWAFYYLVLLEEIVNDRKEIAEILLWPLTLILYLFIIVIWIFKHAWDTVILGFWDFLKEYPTKIKEL